MVDFIIWNTNSVAFHIGSLGIKWYGILLATGFFLSYLTLRKIFKYEKISQDILDNFAIWTVLWTVIGLRLGHILFYEPAYYFSHPAEIFMVWKGGLASHGATIAIIIFIFYFTRKNKIPALWLFDRMAIGIPIAATFVRIGNLMNSEIIGTQTNVPWAFVFTSEDMLPRHPSQLYEALVYLTLYSFLIFYYLKLKGKIPAGRIVGLMLTIIFTARFFIEFIKDVQVNFEKNMTLNMGQLLSIPFIIVGCLLLIYSFRTKSIPEFISKNQLKK